jgi:hypothetical protein
VSTGVGVGLCLEYQDSGSWASASFYLELASVFPSVKWMG